MITGQVILRKAGTRPDGTELFIVCGIIAAPKDTGMKGECQYTVLGNESNNVYLTMCKSDAKDMTEELKGTCPNGWLTKPYWKI